jgi:hypothetical protein
LSSEIGVPCAGKERHPEPRITAMSGSFKENIVETLQQNNNYAAGKKSDISLYT